MPTTEAPTSWQAGMEPLRLSEAQHRAIVNAYRSGVTAARLAATHDLSLSSLNRILRFAKATEICI